MTNPEQPIERVEWRADGNPYNPRFGDTYRSRSGGLRQARDVFLAGCGLPSRWRGCDAFTVLETGFGLGLNFLVTWADWLADPQRSGLLRYQSIEAYPVAALDLLRSARMVAGDAGLDGGWMARAQQLAEVWEATPKLPGWHRCVLQQGAVSLWLGVGDVGQRLVDVPHAADALYLDGHAPARNPGMWSAEVLSAAVAACAAGARLASYSVARSVRDALTAAGAVVARQPGLPPKRHRLEAVLPESS